MYKWIEKKEQNTRRRKWGRRERDKMEEREKEREKKEERKREGK